MGVEGGKRIFLRVVWGWSWDVGVGVGEREREVFGGGGEGLFFGDWEVLLLYVAW